MEPHVYIGMMFFAAAIGHGAMIATIVVGRVMMPSGRALVSCYLAINGAVSLVLGYRLLADTGLDREVVAIGYVLSTAYFLLTAALVGYGLLRALQGRQK